MRAVAAYLLRPAALAALLAAMPAAAQVQADSAYVIFTPPGAPPSFMDMAHLERNGDKVMIHMAERNFFGPGMVMGGQEAPQPPLFFALVEADCKARTLRMTTSFATDDEGKWSFDPVDDAPVPVTPDYATDARMFALACGEAKLGPDDRVFHTEAEILAVSQPR